MRAALCIVAAALGCLWACDQPTSAPVGGASLSLVLPASAVGLDSGHILLRGTASRTITVYPPQTVTIESLEPGPYTVSLAGFANNVVDRFFQTGVTVVAGGNASVTVTSDKFAPFVPSQVTAPTSATSKTFAVSYQPVAGAMRYEAQAATDPSFAAASIKGAGQASPPETSISITVSDYGTYYVRVRALDPNQSAGRWASPPGSIQLKVLFEVTSVQPTDNAANVETGAVVVAQFSDGVDPATLAVAVTSGGTTLATTLSYDSNTRTTTVSAPLLPDKSYQAVVTTAVRDTAGRPLAVARQWTFSTRPPQSVTLPVGGRFPSLAVNGGQVHIAHDNNSELDYSFCAANCTAPASWQNIPVDVAGGAGSLIIDGTGRLYVIYDGDGDLDYGPCAAACTTPGNWQRVLVDQLATTGQWPSLALDGATLHVSYMKSGLRYATCPAGGAGCASTANWRTATVDSGPGGFSSARPSLAVDAAGQLHVSYRNGGPGLEYATCPARSVSCLTPTNWQKVTVDGAVTVGDKTSLVVDPAGRLHVMYYDSTNADLKYATCATPCGTMATWKSSAVVATAGNVGWSPWLVVDKSGRLHVTYFDLDNHSLNYATCAARCTAADNWQTAALDLVGFGAYPQQAATSLTVDGAGRLHATYSTDVPNGLKYIEF